MAPLLAVVAWLLWFVASCDIVQPPYRETPTQGPDTAQVTVLLEDYTGFRCGNCPEANERAEELRQLYGGRLIVMSVHAGFFARPTAPPYTYDFRNPVAEELDRFFGISRAGNPNGMVNRLGYPNNHILGKHAWASAVAAALQRSAPLHLTLQAVMDTTARTVQISVAIRYVEPGTPDHSLALYVVEDSVVQYQLDYRRTPPDVPNYVHRFVLRDGVRGAWGEQLHPTGAPAGTELQRQYTYRFPEQADWNPRRCSIIAVVHRYGTTYEIVQAAIAPLRLQ
ncbi:MAG: Omp28-related outer membrane protein [Candidatus Kapabacteria bacterium]|nr:Omp28-related outer membrane protein [Candidatus Kapabacteria bacterium]MDW8225614.1 Omp28-related outer membrane protein [Bacteroidota bacterium]